MSEVVGLVVDALPVNAETALVRVTELESEAVSPDSTLEMADRAAADPLIGTVMEGARLEDGPAVIDEPELSTVAYGASKDEAELLPERAPASVEEDMDQVRVPEIAGACEPVAVPGM